MNLFATILLDVGLVIGTILIIEFVILLFRNPHRPAWLRKEPAQTAGALLLVGLSCFSFAAFVTGLLEAELHVFTALAMAVALPIAVAFISARAIGFRARLQRADAGESPFRMATGARGERAAPAE